MHHGGHHYSYGEKQIRGFWQKIRKTFRQLGRGIGQAFSYIYRKLYIRSKFWRRFSYGAVAAVFIVISVLFQNFSHLFKDNHYELSPEVLSLIGEVRDDAAENLKSSEDQASYEFALPEQGSDSAEHTGRIADAYSASFSTDPKGGVSVTDKNTQVSMRLVPKFYTGDGRKSPTNQMVYPFGKNQLIYSLKYNGLKEDIIVPEFIDDELDYTFELILPVGAEARTDGQGNIGIFTADNTLFGEMSYGTDEDRELVDKARESAEKTNLIATIPAPIIKDATSKEYSDRSVFELGDKKQRQEKASEANLPDDAPEEVRRQAQAKSTFNVYNLTIASKNLKDLSYPISVDPTLTVSSAADFGNMNVGNGLEIDNTSNLIRRGSMTGGALNSWSSSANMPSAIIMAGVTVYNGYIYSAGGDSSGNIATVYYAKLNTNGAIASDSGCGSSWCTTTSLTTARRAHSAAAWNGYLYVVGGDRSGDANMVDVQYAKISSTNGTIGSWQSATSLPTGRKQGNILAHNGYLYSAGGVVGGSTGTGSVYARLNADGSVASDSGCGSAWCTATSLPSNRRESRLLAYNDWMYIVGGNVGGVSPGPIANSVYRARIASDGSIGSWIQTTSLGTARFGQGAEIWNGYMYVTGGCTAALTGTVCDAGHLNTTEYAPINADGTIGTWRASSTFTTARLGHGSIMWNGYLYVLGGCIAGGNCAYTNTSYYTSVKTAGSLHDANWNATTNFTTSRRWHNAHVYNGFIYVIGGRTTAGVMQNTIQYAAINTNGTVGSWTVSGNTFTAGLRNFASEIYGGYIYISGGMTTDTGSSDINTVEFAQINADGSVGTWSTTTSLSADNAWHDMFAWGGYLYTVGGAGFTNVEYATINSSNGSIGSWSSAGALPNEMLDANVLLHGGYIYLVGGCSGSSCPGGGGNQALYQTTVRYAPVNSDGTIGSWTSATSFTNGRSAKQTLIYNGYLYLLGGYDFTNNTAYNDVQLAPIYSNGSLGSFAYTESLPDTYLSFGAVAWNAYMYIVGGQSGAATTNEVSYQTINNGGQGGPVAFSSGGAFTTARKNHASVAYNGYLYVLGGCTTTTVCTTATTDIRYAPLNNDGSIGTWSATTNTFATARRDLFAFAYNGRMYITGGRDAGGTMQTDIQYATIQTNGNINTSWTTDGTALPSAGLGPGMTLNGNVLYMLGGASTETTTNYAVIDVGTGDVGSFSTTTSLPEGRYQSWAAVYKGNIYSIGGNNASLGRLRSVYYAPLNGNNTIGTWKRATNEINDALNSHSLTATSVSNGYIYITGGENAGGFYNRTQFAAIGSGGDLGAWQTGVASGLTAHGNYASADWRGVMYLSGGQITGTNPVTNTRYASIQAIPRIGSFSRYYDFEVGVKPENLVTRGTKQTGGAINFSYSSNTSCNNTVFGNEQTNSDLALGSDNRVTLNIGSATLARCLMVKYTLDDRHAAIFPDSSSNSQSSITDFDMYYRSNPGTRLRGGRSFTNGVDRGLEANPDMYGGRLLTSNLNDSDLSSYVTASVSPKEDRVLLLAVVYSDGTSSPSAPSSISGFSLTWDLVDSVVGLGGGSTARTIRVYRAQTGSSPPTPGTVTINFSSSREVTGWSLMEFSGVALGSNGANAIGTVDTDETSGTAVSLDLGSEIPNSYTVVFANNNVNINGYYGNGAELAQFASGNVPTTNWHTRYSSTGERNWTLTDTGTTRKAVIGVRMLPN